MTDGETHNGTRRKLKTKTLDTPGKNWRKCCRCGTGTNGTKVEKTEGGRWRESARSLWETMGALRAHNGTNWNCMAEGVDEELLKVTHGGSKDFRFRNTTNGNRLVLKLVLFTNKL